MRPDEYIKCRPMKFEQAVKGQPVHIKWGYWISLCYYRCHNKCKGLEDNDEFLRGICEIEKDDWEKAKPIIFGGFYQLDVNELWQNSVAYEDWVEDSANYEKAVKKGQHANAMRWGKKKK